MSQASNSGCAAEQAALYQKRMSTELVRVRFARFGDDVLAIVLGYALQPKRMPSLLQQFKLRSPPDLEMQLSVLWNFIAEAGSREFIKQVKHRKREQVQPLEPGEEIGGEAPCRAEAPEVVPAPSLEPAPAAPPKPVVYIKTPEYSGPERRSGMDRRNGSDRRNNVIVIRINQRYGGDRRKRPKGRRKTDGI